MAPSFTLQYYDGLFGTRNAVWAEIIRALADEMDDYAAAVVGASAAGTDLAAVRHSHRPSLQNLGDPLPEPADGLDADEAAGFARAAAELAAGLRAEALRTTGEPFPGGPGLPPPCPGG